MIDKEGEMARSKRVYESTQIESWLSWVLLKATNAI